MTKDERWMTSYKKAMRFLKENGKKPSRYIPKERNQRS